MGRYFPSNAPLSVAEVLSAGFTDKEIHPPRRCSKETLEHLHGVWRVSGAVLRADARSSTVALMRREQLVREDCGISRAWARSGQLAVVGSKFSPAKPAA